MFGYKVENGVTVIDKDAALKIRTLYENYLSGLGLAASAKNAGIYTYHGTVKRMITNRHYIGDEVYPPIIDTGSFEKAQEELVIRAKKLGRTNKVGRKKEIKIPLNFSLKPVKNHYDDPFTQAEYLYSLIKSEVI
ncbi:recombinase family protein [Lachnospiraceae bacterium ZAX-1]